VGLAIDRFRRCEHLKYEPKGLHEFIVESREPGAEHRLTRNICLTRGSAGQEDRPPMSH
jgi:hypothetical protein